MKNVNIILDTDVGSDCDDMAALAYLVYAKRYLGVNIGAITYSHTSPYGVGCIRALFRSLGESIPPVGASKIIEGSRDLYCREVFNRFATEEDALPHLDATKLLRSVLAENENSVICAIGPMTNIAALLESEADEILFAILNTYETLATHSGLMPGYCKSVDWRTKNGVPCGYNYLADNYYFLLSAYVGRGKLSHPAVAI